MSKYRTDLVQKVFEKLDITQQGLIDVTLIVLNFEFRSTKLLQSIALVGIQI